jgi:RNA polymerase sigma factor (sigma-70 family)
MLSTANRALHYVREIAAEAATGLAADATLLSRYVAANDRAAFTEMVVRHGPMVLRACRRLLVDHHQAEDAFQATFLVLARKAGSIRPASALAAWLHGMACRIARAARTASARRRAREATTPGLAPHDPHPDPLAELTARDALQVVDEEVRRLPEAHRLPVLLCCLEGLSLEEAAQHLGWTLGSVKGWLERGRAQLRRRLAQRGLTLPAALALAELSRGLAPAALTGATVLKALAFAAGERAQMQRLCLRPACFGQRPPAS